MKNKLISLLTAAILTSSITAMAEVIRVDLEVDANMAYTAVPESGKCGDNMTWELTEDGTLIFSGIGDMYNYYTEPIVTELGAITSGSLDIPWTKNNNSKAILNVVIPEGITSISYGAFFWTRIPAAIIPDSVQYLGQAAFSTCSRMKIAVLPDDIEELAPGCFISCSSLEYIHLPKNLKKINASALSHLDSLKNLDIPESVTDIDERACKDIYNLQSIRIPSKITEIKNSTFAICDNLTDVSFPAGLKIIGDSAFNNDNKLTTVILPDGLESIGKMAFSTGEFDRNKFEIYVPASVKEIGKDAFGYKGITIYGYEGSYAEEYAKENAKSNNITFVPVTETMYKEQPAPDYPTKAEFIAQHQDYINKVKQDAEESFKSMQPQLTVIPGEPIAIYNNLDKIIFDDEAQPFIDDAGRTQIPIRAVAESMGCDVDWNGETKTATITKGEKTISITIGENVIKKDNFSIKMDTSAQIRDSRTYIPLRFAAEALGYQVVWAE